MKHNYRLSPKPGIIRTNRTVATGVKPVIINNINNVKHKMPNQQQVKSIKPNPIKSNVIKSNIAKPNVIKPNIIAQNDQAKNIDAGNRLDVIRKEVAKSKAGNLLRNPIKASPVKRQKDFEYSRNLKSIDSIKNVGVGRILVMVACGPSILEADLPKLKNHPLIDMMSINKPDLRIHPTTYWVFCDQSQYKNNQQLFDTYTGIPINVWSIRARHKNQILVRNKSGKGFSKDLTQGYYIGRSTTYANMQTALWMNYDKIYIFGCDMCKPPNTENLHFYGTNPDVNPNIRVQRFAKEAEFYAHGAKQLSPSERQRFVFCSSYNQWPFIKEFENMDHKIAVNHIINHANSMRNS